MEKEINPTRSTVLVIKISDCLINLQMQNEVKRGGGVIQENC